MNEQQQLETLLRQTANWRRYQRAWAGFWRGAFFGAIACLALIALYKLLPLPNWAPVAGGLAVAFGALVGLLAGAWRRSSLLETARWVDQQKHLEERVSTALELAAAGGDADWKRLLTRDAAQHVHDLQPRRLQPLGLPTVSRWTLLILAAALGLGFVPEYRTQAYVQRQQDAGNIRQVGQQLADMIRHTLVEKPPVLPPVREALEQAAQAGDQLVKAPLTRGEALRDLASVTDTLAAQSQQLQRNPALKRMADAARTPGGSEGPSAADLQKKLADLKEALGKTAADPEKLGTLQKRMDALKQKAASLAGSDGALGEGDRSQLAGEMSQLADAAQSLGAALPGLEAAIEALKAGKADLFLRDLENALNDLEKLKQTAQALQQCQQQAEQLGKDLPEQLEKGQSRAAQQSLEKMIDQLKSANPSPQELQKLMDEVARAVQPGSQYGRVGEHLQQAVKNLQQGQNPGAAQNLADAARELDQLRQQMADSQGLQAALEALQRAQAAIAMGKSWDELAGMCSACQGQGCGLCQGTGKKLRWGHGGYPGMGVGTWTDQSGWRFFDESMMNAPFDPSGVQRPDMDPRALRDRPDVLNPNLAPTKVSGQFQPGGSMPSITLKDLSIKGTSRVEFEGGGTAEQTDAQSALEQDKVPRIYQESVRDYFDDLK